MRRLSRPEMWIGYSLVVLFIIFDLCLYRIMRVAENLNHYVNHVARTVDSEDLPGQVHEMIRRVMENLPDKEE